MTETDLKVKIEETKAELERLTVELEKLGELVNADDLERPRRWVRSLLRYSQLLEDQPIIRCDKIGIWIRCSVADVVHPG